MKKKPEEIKKERSMSIVSTEYFSTDIENE